MSRHFLVLSAVLGAACSTAPGTNGGAASNLGASAGNDSAGSINGVAGMGGGATTTSAGGSTTGTGMTNGGAASSNGGSGATPGAAGTGSLAGSTNSGAGAGGASLGGAGGEQTSGGTETGGEAAGGAASGGAASSGGDGGAPTSGEFGNPEFIVGVDISFVQEQEDQGTRFSDGGTEQDIFEILTDHGFNYVRLRLFHTPGNPEGYQNEFVSRAEPYCDLAHTLEMAARVKAAGMGFLLDLHYSDTWADPDDQHKPLAWEGLSFDELTTAVHDYTVDTLEAFGGAGALPDMVQVGNEITPGMLHPDGHSSQPNDGNWDKLAVLLSAGLSAVKEVSPEIRTALHIERIHQFDTTTWWFDSALDRGVQFDIMAQSAYTMWHGDPETDWRPNLARMAERYPDHSFLIMEYSQAKRAANDVVHDTPRGLGTFLWEPTFQDENHEPMFSPSGATNELIDTYDQIVTDYGL